MPKFVRNVAGGQLVQSPDDALHVRQLLQAMHGVEFVPPGVHEAPSVQGVHVSLA